jgi:hypothetical protein
MVRGGYRRVVSDHEERDDEQYNTQGAPNHGSTEADTASGGAPEDPDQGIDPDTGTDDDGAPVENPSGG